MDSRAIARFRRNKGALIGAMIVAVILAFSLFAPLLTSFRPEIPDFEHGRGPFGTPGAPSSLHWFGTDTIFRDVLARLAEGGRLSLEVAFAATVIAMGIGTAVGVLSGYFQGTRVRVDHLAEGTGAATAAVGALAAFASRAQVFGWRLLAFAAWSFAGAMALRTLARVIAALRGDAGTLRIGDLLDTALFATIVAATLHDGFGRALGSRHFLAGVVLLGVGSSIARGTWSRVPRLGRGARRVSFLRVDFDDALMRVVDVLLSFPFLLLLMAVSSAVDRTSEATIFLVLGLTAWTNGARVIRSKTLQVRELEFIVASRALGQPTRWILLRHVFPNIAGIAIILATNSVAYMIVAEATLSFLGLSVPLPAASWGRMLDEGRPYFSAAPWLLIAPAVAILLAVLGFNLLGEGLRDAFDPKDA